MSQTELLPDLEFKKGELYIVKNHPDGCFAQDLAYCGMYKLHKTYDENTFIMGSEERVLVFRDVVSPKFYYIVDIRVILTHEGKVLVRLVKRGDGAITLAKLFNPQPDRVVYEGI
jgi:hypothetical protein